MFWVIAALLTPLLPTLTAYQVVSILTQGTHLPEPHVLPKKIILSTTVKTFRHNSVCHYGQTGYKSPVTASVACSQASLGSLIN